MPSFMRTLICAISVYMNVTQLCCFSSGFHVLCKLSNATPGVRRVPPSIYEVNWCKSISDNESTQYEGPAHDPYKVKIIHLQPVSLSSHSVSLEILNIKISLPGKYDVFEMCFHS